MRERNLSDTRSLAKRKVNKAFVFKNLTKYLKPYLAVIVFVFLLNIFGTVLTVLAPKLCGKAIDLIRPLGGTDFKKIAFYAVLLCVLYIISAVTHYLSSVGMAFVSRRMIKKMRCDVFSKLTSLPVSYFDNRQTGDIISVLSYDIDTVGESLANDVIMLLKSGVQIVGSLVMMLTIVIPLIIESPAISAPLLLVFAASIPLSAIVTRFIVRKVQPLFRARSAKLGELNGFVEEMIAGQKTTKAYNSEKKLIADFEKKNKEAVDAYSKAEYYGTMTGPSVNFINNTSMLLVSVFGGLVLMNAVAGVTVGGISAFILYTRKFSGPINEVANIFGDFQSAIAAAERVFVVLNEESEKADKEGAEELLDVEGNVDIESLTFGYVADKPVLTDFSMHAEKGQTIAIVGHTGAGKTTIINLLMRFYDPDGGTIKIDGKDIACVTRKSLRRAFTMVLQDTWLFAGTVYENIAYGNANATRDEVIRVCKEAKIHSFISKLPNGYDTELNDNAINISKGQKQLLTIARAMLLNSHILILDEATSNVDTRTEQLIQESMRTLMKGKTCFVIAHRLSTIKNADLILVMKDGNVVEQGTHSQLMKNKGYYSELYYSQFASY